MGEIAIRFENLSKVYKQGKKSVKALTGLDLKVEAGQVYGFLGPNGAGKSTTIHLLMNLVQPTSGAAYVFGKNVREHHTVLKGVGALIEGAAFYGYMTGRDNLEVLSRTAGYYNAQHISNLLAQVGLTDRADQNVSGYSMGMQQRLGIAAALLNDPDLIILDEPTNGLDPAGIQETRQFIHSLVYEYGKTVFFSSHLLNEVEQICDRVAIISDGKIVREGIVKELLNEKGAEIHIEATPLKSATSTLQTKWGLEQKGDWLIIQASPNESSDVVRLLVSSDIKVHQVIIQKQTLEDYFMSVTNNTSLPQEEM